MSKVQIVAGGTSGMGLATAINMIGVVNMTEVFLPLMTEGSTLVNFSSATGYYHRPLPEETAIWDEPNAPDSYLTPMLEGQAGHYDSIAAGTALKRLGNPEEMAAFVGNLLDPRLGYLTGTDLLMDGGKLAVRTKQLA